MSRKMPTRIRITNNKGVPQDTQVEDADSGEVLEGVMSMAIALSKTTADVQLTITQHWPITSEDYAVNNPPSYEGLSERGVNVERHTYHIKRLDMESW